METTQIYALSRKKGLWRTNKCRGELVDYEILLSNQNRLLLVNAVNYLFAQQDFNQSGLKVACAGFIFHQVQRNIKHILKQLEIRRLNLT